MSEIPQIKDFHQFHEAFNEYDYNVTIFRGVRDWKYELKPRVARITDFNYHSDWSLEKKERDLLRIFKERAIPHLKYNPSNEWDWLAIAQHFRLPTRLLDWSRNPLVAAYFAVEKNNNKDSAIYALTYPHYLDVDTINENKDPFKFGIFTKFIPPHITNRITAQEGVFTIREDPTRPLKTSGELKIDKFIIDNNFKRELKKILYHYGIHQASLFPDLESIANHIEWMKRDVHDIEEHSILSHNQKTFEDRKI